MLQRAQKTHTGRWVETQNTERAYSEEWSLFSDAVSTEHGKRRAYVGVLSHH